MPYVRIFKISALSVVLLLAAVAWFWSPVLWSLVVLGPLLALGLYDLVQRTHNVTRNFPVIGHLRYLFEAIRPEIQQYFVESDISGRPFNRELRSVVYQRAKNVLDTRPFGTIRDLYEDGTEWINHSLAPSSAPETAPRILIGEGRCRKPYASSLLNISAMSFGSLGKNAILALNGGAKLGDFAHNTGEGGLSPHHLEPGGDLIWQIGTGYFGCRTPDGRFDPEEFAKKSSSPSVKMIEIKLSQGAKPGHGGILPASKVTAEISEIRGVPMGETVISPPHHSAFGTPRELLGFIGKLRELSGGKPVGFKLCVGRLEEFMGICKAMVETGEVPDFIAVDGSEGGTGAAPMEFSNAVGVPLTEGLLVVHNCLVGCGVRDKIRVIASGKIVTGFNIIQRIAIAADLCSAARPMMFALGCIQALRCNTNTCPVGVATQDPDLGRGLDVEDKRVRVSNYHRNTVHAALEILGAAGLSSTEELAPHHIIRRVDSTRILSYADIYDYFEPDEFLNSRIDKRGAYTEIFLRSWKQASPDRF